MPSCGVGQKLVAGNGMIKVYYESSSKRRFKMASLFRLKNPFQSPQICPINNICSISFLSHLDVLKKSESVLASNIYSDIFSRV